MEKLKKLFIKQINRLTGTKYNAAWVNTSFLFFFKQNKRTFIWKKNVNIFGRNVDMQES